jgi:hypothetical protein
MSIEFTEQDFSVYVASLPLVVKTRPKRRSIERQLQQLRGHVKGEVMEHMAPWLMLLDESVRFFICFNELLDTHPFTRVKGTFAMEVARLRSHVVAIRDLVMLGQESPAHIIARSFLDDIEIASVVVGDPDFAIAYMSEDDDHDQEKFWRTNIGYGRIYSRYEAFLVNAGLSIDAAREQVDYHREMKNALSSYVHPSPASTFRALAVPSWIYPGRFKVKGVGHTSIHMPKLCLFIARESSAFASTMMTLIIRSGCPEALEGIEPCKEFQSASDTTFLLQELIETRGEELYEAWRVRSEIAD